MRVNSTSSIFFARIHCAKVSLRRFRLFLMVLVFSNFTVMQSQANDSAVSYSISSILVYNNETNEMTAVNRPYNHHLRAMILSNAEMVRNAFYNEFFEGPIRSYLLSELYNLYQEHEGFYIRYFLGDDVADGISTYNSNHDPLTGVRAEIEQRRRNAPGRKIVRGLKNVPSPGVRAPTIVDVTGLTGHGAMKAFELEANKHSAVFIGENRPRTLFHYTDVISLMKIIETGTLFTGNGIYGAGQYFTDIRPEQVVAPTDLDLTIFQRLSKNLSLQGLSRALFGGLGTDYSGVEAWIEIDISQLHVRQSVKGSVVSHNWDGTPIINYQIEPHNFFIPNKNNLRVGEILVSYGEVLVPQRR